MGRAGRTRSRLPERGWTYDPNDHVPYNSKYQDIKYDGYGTLYRKFPGLYQDHLAGKPWQEQKVIKNTFWDQLFEAIEVNVVIKS